MSLQLLTNSLRKPCWDSSEFPLVGIWIRGFVFFRPERWRSGPCSVHMLWYLFFVAIVAAGFGRRFGSLLCEFSGFWKIALGHPWQGIRANSRLFLVPSLCVEKLFVPVLRTFMMSIEMGHALFTWLLCVFPARCEIGFFGYGLVLRFSLLNFNSYWVVQIC